MQALKLPPNNTYNYIYIYSIYYIYIYQKFSGFALSHALPQDVPSSVLRLWRLAALKSIIFPTVRDLVRSKHVKTNRPVEFVVSAS